MINLRIENEIILGDLNIAPLPDDVWSHKQLLNVVSHTPQETDLLLDVLHSGSFEDLIRQFFPIPEKVFPGGLIDQKIGVIMIEGEG